MKKDLEVTGRKVMLRNGTGMRRRMREGKLIPFGNISTLFDLTDCSGSEPTSEESKNVKVLRFYYRDSDSDFCTNCLWLAAKSSSVI